MNSLETQVCLPAHLFLKSHNGFHDVNKFPYYSGVTVFRCIAEDTTLVKRTFALKDTLSKDVVSR